MYTSRIVGVWSSIGSLTLIYALKANFLLMYQTSRNTVSKMEKQLWKQVLQ